MLIHNHKIKDIDIDAYEDIYGQCYFPNTYYNSLDFIYKYTKEVIIKELFNVDKSFFTKIISNIEDHRFSREKSINSGSLYNAAYPTLSVNVRQDFSGAGKRTTMAQSSLFYILDPYMMMKTIFEERNISIQLSSNIYKYQINLIGRFDSAFECSNFISRIYNRIHVNKHYLPNRSLLRYRLDKKIYNSIRQVYKSEFEDDLTFLNYLDTHTNNRIIREFDRSTGNYEYFLLLPIRPMLRIGTPEQTDNNSSGSLRESMMNLLLEVEVELPNALYFTAPMPILKGLILSIYRGDNFDEEHLLYETEFPKDGKDKSVSENEIKREEIIADKTIKKKKTKLNKEERPVIRMDDLVTVDQKLVTMPEVSPELLELLDNKKEIYTTTVMISDITDVICTDDKTLLNLLKTNKNNKYILKIIDENGKEVSVKKVSIYDDYLDVLCDEEFEDTIVVLSIYS